MRVLLLMLTSVFVGSSAYAQSDQIRRGPAPAWVTQSDLLPVPETVGGPMFVRRQDAEVHLSGQGQAQYVGSRIKILQSAALSLGNISIAWTPQAGAPIVHKIQVVREARSLMF